MNDLQKGSLSQTRRNGGVRPSVRVPLRPSVRPSPVISFFTPPPNRLFCLAIPAPCLSRLSRRRRPLRVRPRRWPPVSSEEVRKMKKAGSSPLPSSAEPHHLSWKSVQDKTPISAPQYQRASYLPSVFASKICSSVRPRTQLGTHP